MTVGEVDRDLMGWRDIFMIAVESEDLAGEIEARDEIDRLLDLRSHIPQQR